MNNVLVVEGATGRLDVIAASEAASIYPEAVVSADGNALDGFAHGCCGGSVACLLVSSE